MNGQFRYFFNFKAIYFIIIIPSQSTGMLQWLVKLFVVSSNSHDELNVFLSLYFFTHKGM